VARIGTIRLRHEGQVSALAFSRDDSLLVSGGERDDLVRLWDVATGKLLGVRRGHRGGVQAVAFSPAGKRVVSTDWRGNVFLWETEADRSPRVLRDPGGQDAQMAVRFSADGKEILTCSGRFGPQGAARIWNAAHGTLRRRFSVPVEPFSRPSFSPGGELLAACGSDRVVSIHDVAGARQVLRLPRHKDEVHIAVFSPDARYLASAGRTNLIHFWELATGSLIRTLPAQANLLIFSPDGRSLVCADSSHDRVQVWDLRSGKARRSFRISRPTALAFSHDGKTLAVATRAGVVHLVDFPGGKETRPGADVPAGMVPLAFLSGGSRLAVGWSDGLAIWEIGKPRQADRARPLRQLRRIETVGRPLALSGDGKFALVGALYHAPHLLDVAEEVDRHRIEVRNVLGGNFTRDGKRLGIFSGEGPSLWDVATGKRAQLFKAGTAQPGAGALSPDGKVLVTVSHRGTLHFWDADTGKERRQVALTTSRRRERFRLVFSGNGKLLAIADERSRLHLWDMAASRFVRTLEVPEVFALSANGKLLAEVEREKEIRIRDITTGKTIQQMRVSAGAVRALLFSPDGKLLASGGPASSVLLWEVR
jgi:WD40 repeat protein